MSVWGVLRLCHCTFRTSKFVYDTCLHREGVQLFSIFVVVGMENSKLALDSRKILGKYRYFSSPISYLSHVDHEHRPHLRHFVYISSTPRSLKIIQPRVQTDVSCGFSYSFFFCNKTPWPKTMYKMFILESIMVEEGCQQVPTAEIWEITSSTTRETRESELDVGRG